MNILTIDTATDYELISLSTEHGVFEFNENVKMSHSITMFDSIKGILDKASMELQNIDLIAAGVGPGSFTGVRIAVSTARMIAQILDIPLVGLITQDIFAASVENNPDENILVSFDAKKSRVFGALYRGGQRCSHECFMDAGDYSIEFMLSSIPEGSSLLCIGDGCFRYRNIIEEKSALTGVSCRFLENFIPSGASTSCLAMNKYRQSPDKYIFFGNTVPVYARKSDAEIARDAKRTKEG
ncbi:MAG TPA: tRNA (adenosine(37)-N6)-threonylcarbamoyltransferase complex dimerization subunit type 1 TsaB [Spirochaetota bacterium]|nr:tRNA (adenosine(37)-N6)-threonylcarbamoyltransferase complex dimerization subunit type 1 TsaB [Spirochaetota bacterium]